MSSLFLLCQIILTLVCQALCYDPIEDLNCLNDYDAEMTCSFPSESLRSCSGYKLNVTQKLEYDINRYTCIFERSLHNAICECKIEVQGFITEEIFSTTLLEGTKVLLKKEFRTVDYIKPKPPVLFVEKTENGNFHVTWDDNYKGKNVFTDSLSINLTYVIKGENETMSKKVSNTVGFHDIVGSSLQPKTEYILTAKMSSDYNDEKIYSDQSEAVYFTTAPLPNEIVKLVVPPLCIGLLIIICIIFICVLRMKSNWWDKIAKPTIKNNFGDKKGHVLPPSFNAVSPIHVEVLKLDLEEEKKLISPLCVNPNNERSSHSVESSTGDYGQALCDSGSNPVQDFRSQIELAMAKDFLRLTKNTPTNKFTEMPYNSVESSSKDRNCANRDSGNCSGSSVFSNKSYLEGSNDDSSFLDLSCDHSNDRKVSDSIFKQENSIDIIKSLHNFPANHTLDEGYQAFSAVVEKRNDVDGGVKLSSEVDADDKVIRKSLITSTNPLYPSLFHHDDTITRDDPYKAFQDVSKNIGGQWSTSISTERTLNECGALKFPHVAGQIAPLQNAAWAFLNIPPAVEIDLSYHTV